MMTSLWFVGLVAVLVLDMRTGALQQKELASHRCYSCAANATSCEAPAAVDCPADYPVCATTATAPNFTSSLSCAAAAKTPCSLTQTSDKVFKLTCVCMENLCNAPFSTEIQKQLLHFTSTSSNFTNVTTEYTEAFLKFVNFTGENVYKSLTVEVVQSTKAAEITVKSTTTTRIVTSTPGVQTTVVHPAEVIMPRAEALKHDSTAPSDDDEDESEGSGAYEETKLQRQPVSAPANPSSYLPAENNKAPHILPNLMTTLPIFFFIV